MSILIVAAVRAEAARITNHEVLITGVGTVPAAIALTRRLATGPRPERIVNVGTAGALHDAHAGVYEITAIKKHDFDSAAVEGITTPVFPRWFTLPVTGALPTANLVTGDTFVNDSALRDRLAAEAQLVDMEAYALAAAAATFDVPFTALKQISDSADESAMEHWVPSLERAAQELADALAMITS
ncbi:nucleosidase [Corynebacterium breve]|uniref:Nucleosidase n=1 Tax=Corynebacterium breve TaxID=3049799 RepID=A0ABY8VEC6_9CORY|nr:nucleosidase [Corynebacterium breve]WIM67457.1 nucleosidase [Corynebacterium breve]